jgi:hypothetical protein
MSDISVLAYVSDPFAVQASRYLIREPTGEQRHVSALEVSEFPTHLITYDLPTLIDDMRRLGHTPPIHVLDIGDALKLLVGLPRDEGGEKLWNVWPALKRRFADRAEADLFERITLSRQGRPDLDKLSRLLETAGKALAELWQHLAGQLRHQGEYDRLTTVEWPLQSAFAYRQFRGVPVNSAGALALLEQISAKKYEAYRQVAEFLNKSPSGLNYWNIHPHLIATDVAYLMDSEPGGQLQTAFEMAADASPFANAFVSLMKAGRDASVVRRALGGTDRLYPIFNVQGTVSSRILVSDPYLQQLRRAYRSLIAPEQNHRLVYLDYAQFEPGVLAGLSGDAKLTAAYNEGDLYTALANVLFGDGAQRPIAKQVFLAFSYGMTPDRIAMMLAKNAAADERSAYSLKIGSFFAAFPDLANFRVKQQEALQSDGYVKSLFGNRRMRTTTSELLSLKEQRWAMNHPVQSTASLIFKEALNGIIVEFGVEPVILPMHDAVLLQFPDDQSFDDRARRASEIMIECFSSRIPGVKAKIKSGDFTD